MDDGATSFPVVLRFRDGATRRCRLVRDFSPQDAVIQAVAEDGEQISVAVRELKAVFFVKSPRHRDADVEIGLADDDSRPEGAFAKVEFFDGEILRGRVLHYSVEHAGFFLFPSSRDSNNEKVFVVAAALQTVSIEG